MIDGYFELYPEKRKQIIYLFLDEIQNITGWEKFVRRVLDTENCRIFISGSSSKLLSKEIATSLRGRTLTYEIFTLSFKEYLRFKNIDINLHSSESLSKIVNAFEQYKQKGGFPETVSYENDLWHRTINECIEFILYRDIIERFGVKNTFLMKFLLNYLSKNISTVLSINKLFNDFKSQGLKLSKNTLYEYISYLEDAYAFFTVPIYSKSFSEQLRNPKKVYAVDISFKRASDIHEHIGHVYENIIFTELRRKFKDIFYYKGKQEANFYIPSEKLLINAYYDTSNINTKKREYKSLSEAMAYFSINESVLLNSLEEKIIETNADRIYVLLLWKWLLI